MRVSSALEAGTVSRSLIIFPSSGVRALALTRPVARAGARTSLSRGAGAHGALIVSSRPLFASPTPTAHSADNAFPPSLPAVTRCRRQVWVNQYNLLYNNVPFGGKKQSGIGE